MALYIDARAACNGWIQEIQFAMASNAKDVSARYLDSFNAAVEKAYNFINKARSNVGLETLPTPKLKGLDMKALQDVINRYQEDGKEIQTALNGAFDALKWPTWNEIGQPSGSKKDGKDE